MPLSMVDVINAGARPVYNHPLTRRDESDMVALVQAVLCGGDISRIGSPRGMKEVISDEALDGDPYHTRFETEFIER